MIESTGLAAAAGGQPPTMDDPNPPAVPAPRRRFALDGDLGGSLALLLLCLVLYLPGAGAISLTDPDEVFYSQTAREMLAQRSPLTPLLFGQPQFEKPPLYYWLLAASFRTLGLGPFAARLVSALAGAFGVVGLFLVLRRALAPRMALLFSTLLASSLLYHGLSRVVLTDALFTALVSLAFALLFVWYRSARQAWLQGFAAAAALAVLTKGPLGILLPLLGFTVFLLLERRRGSLRALLLGRWWLTFLVLALPWYVYVTAVYGRAFVGEFLIHDNWDRFLYAEHASLDRWYFYPALFVVGLLPWTPLLAALGRNFRRFATEWRFALCWLAPGLVFLSFAHSKLPSYPAPLFPGLVLALALSLPGLAQDTVRLRVAAGGIVALGLGAFAGLAWADRGFPGSAGWITLACAGLGVALVVSGALLWSRRVGAAIGAGAAGLALVLLLLGLTVPPSADAMLSIRQLAEVADAAAPPGAPILAERTFVRGIHFYTGRTVVVTAPRPNPFWSPHPLEILAGDKALSDYLEERPVVVCVLGTPKYERLKSLLGASRRLEVLATGRNQVVVVSREAETAAGPASDSSSR